MSLKQRLLVLMGGRSGEHEVSLSSARSVLAVLNAEHYDVLVVGITHEGDWVTGENVLQALEEGRTTDLTRVTLLPVYGDHHVYAMREGRLEPLVEVDVVFPVLHGTYGEDGSLQGLLELCGLAYVGSGVLGSAVGMDKAVFKDVLRAHQLPVLDSITVTRREVDSQGEAVIAKAEALADYPLFVKPANLGSSVGITKCRSRSDLYEGLLEAARFDRRILVERGLEHPREIEVSVMGNDLPQASVPGEVVPSDDFYTYAAKYLDGRSTLIIPADLPQETAEAMRRAAEEAYRLTDCAGLARVDFLLDRTSGRFYISEVNTIPGFTSISMYPKLWEASGLNYAMLIDRLIDLALQRKQDRSRNETRYEGAQ